MSTPATKMLAEIAPQLMRSAASADSAEEFAEHALGIIHEQLACESISLIRNLEGHWQSFAQVGADEMPPDALLADAADAERVRIGDQWQVVPFQPPAERGWLLAGKGHAEEATDILCTLASLVGWAMALNWRAATARERERRLEAIVQIAAHWHTTLDTEQLLHEIAKTSTELFDVDRAIIFLWHRRKKMLIGKPALGTDAELTISDDAGITGQVVQTGEPQRAGSGRHSHLLNEGPLAETLSIQSALCVPIIGQRGKILGAFELHNKKDGMFTDLDQQGLVELASHAATAIENSRRHQELLATRSQLSDEQANKVRMIGSSARIIDVRHRIERVAATDLSVLVLGENGTGKEIASRMIHDLSDRAEHPFLAVNCAALTETLLEAELFGREKGAFTDADQSRAGKFEAAAQGTLFLDEVGELSPRAQAKLLRVLEEKVVVRVGSTEPIATDARVIAATNRDLPSMVRERLFREDLFFRLNVVTIELPPLRERQEDVVPLAEHFIEQIAAQSNRPALPLSTAAKQRLTSHDWPGNVRELRNLMERMAFLASGPEIDAADLGQLTSGSGIRDGLNLTDATKEFQVEYIQQQIAAAGGSMTEAARRLGLHRSNLYRKMRQLGMQTD